MVRVVISSAELSEKLEDDFVLFVGSAVSGFSPPKLAMVDTVVDGIIGLLPTKFGASYIDQLFAKYAESLILDNGAYRNLTRSTKFEEFLWFVSRALACRVASSNRSAV